MRKLIRQIAAIGMRAVVGIFSAAKVGSADGIVLQ